MKNKAFIFIAMITVSSALPFFGWAQKEDDRIIRDSRETKTAYIKADPAMEHLFADSYGYAIFPNVGKGAAVVGGAAGKGTVYYKGKLIGMASMIQATVGAQVGGKAYREVIFFENKEALDRFKDNKVEFSEQVSAVAVKAGASANMPYKEGVKIFTQDKAGLMAEASIGGQKFSYKNL